jgi:hypothetical protein
MGGGNHGGIIGGLGGKFSTEPDCYSLDIESTLYSPNPVVIAKLKKNSILDIEYDSGNRSLLASYKGELAGTILGVYIAQIISCIVQKNVEFKGIVRELQGGNCTLTIKAK